MQMSCIDASKIISSENLAEDPAELLYKYISMAWKEVTEPY